MKDNKTQQSKTELIARHVYWRRQYRRRRYLEHLKEDALVQRAKDLLANQVTLTDDLKIGFYDFRIDGDYLMMAWTHVLEEFVLRNYRPPAPFEGRLDDMQIPKYDWPGVQRAIKQIRSISYSEDGALFKYGKEKFLRPMVETGSIRIMAAATYDDPSLNPAIRDSELEISLISLPSEVRLQAFDGKTGKPKGIIRPTGNVIWTERARSNVYVYCLASRFDPRMFGDFEADSCVVIKDPVRFVETIQAEWDRRFEEWAGVALPVSYIDPFGDYTSEPDVYFSKHFRYGYQREFRLVWLPPTPSEDLDPVFLDIGSLKDYCELISLENS